MRALHQNREAKAMQDGRVRRGEDTSKLLKASSHLDFNCSSVILQYFLIELHIQMKCIFKLSVLNRHRRLRPTHNGTGVRPEMLMSVRFLLKLKKNMKGMLDAEAAATHTHTPYFIRKDFYDDIYFKNVCTAIGIAASLTKRETQKEKRIIDFVPQYKCFTWQSGRQLSEISEETKKTNEENCFDSRNPNICASNSITRTACNPHWVSTIETMKLITCAK